MTKAVIMAGGKGTRLGNLTHEIPKPMVKVAGIPILERQINNLKADDIKDITLVIGYLGEVIQNYFKDGKDRSEYPLYRSRSIRRSGEP